MVKDRDRWQKAKSIKPSELSQAELQDFSAYMLETMKSPEDYGPPFEPPWKAFPHIPNPYSIGWRMGPGEDYMQDFQKWYACATNAERASYKIQWPEPESFTAWFVRLDEKYPLK